MNDSQFPGARRDFHLFRLQLHLSQQLPLLTQQVERTKLLLDAVNEKPTTELSRQSVWHIGNVERLDEHSTLFALGRQAPARVGVIDPVSKDFLDVDEDQALYTSILLDARLQVAAVAPHSRIARTASSIASRLKDILASTKSLQISEASISIDSILDPLDFFAQVDSAYAVVKLSTSFGRPNVFDANEDFQKPLQRVVYEAAANKVVVALSGEDLQRTIVKDLTRASAAIGNPATAQLVDQRGGPRRTISTKDNPAKVSGEDPTGSHRVRRGSDLLANLRQTYERIRNRG